MLTEVRPTLGPVGIRRMQGVSVEAIGGQRSEVRREKSALNTVGIALRKST
jgi:hypothetical protein